MDRYLSARSIAWDPARFEASWSEFENFVITADDQVVGLLRVLLVEGALEIRDLQIVPEHMRKGIGTWAIGQANEMAADRGLGELRLRVWSDNPAAQLYARLGFRAVSFDRDVIQMARGAH